MSIGVDRWLILISFGVRAHSCDSRPVFSRAGAASGRLRPVDESEERSGRRVSWRERLEARRAIPELAGVEPARAALVLERARARAWRCKSVWLAIAVLGGACVALCVGLVSLARVLRPYWLLPPLMQLAFLAVWFIGGEWVRNLVLRPALRRCVRAELGTHCGGCDYDLRATPDPRPPAVARCPECGKVVPRNVHRRTIVPPIAGKAVDARAGSDGGDAGSNAAPRRDS